MPIAIDIGISEKERAGIATGLSRLLADTYTLYLKTHNFHWNVTGPMFQPLHQIFEDQYKELADAVDEIAERIRSLGFTVPAGYRAFSQLTAIEEEEEPGPAEQMVRALVEGHEAVIRTVRSLFPIVHRAIDESTFDLLTGRLSTHEKTAWMLRSFLA